jgi:hypothetical protein
MNFINVLLKVYTCDLLAFKNDSFDVTSKVVVSGYVTLPQMLEKKWKFQ